MIESLLQDTSNMDSQSSGNIDGMSFINKLMIGMAKIDARIERNEARLRELAPLREKINSSRILTLLDSQEPPHLSTCRKQILI